MDKLAQLRRDATGDAWTSHRDGRYKRRASQIGRRRFVLDSKLLAFAAALAAPLMWSVGGVVMRSVSTAGPWEQIFWRAVGGGTAVALALALMGSSRAWTSWRQAGISGWASAACVTGSFVVHVLAINATTVANVLFLQTASPLLMPVLAWAVLGERLDRRTAIAVVIAAAGLAPIVIASAGGGRLAGDLLALASALFGATNILIVRRWRAVNLVPVVVVASLATILISALFALPLSTSNGDILALLVLGVVQLAIGLSLFLYALRHLPAGPVALMTLLEPVVGPVLVWLVIGEAPPTTTIVGGSVVIMALLLCASATARNPSPSPEPAR